MLRLSKEEIGEMKDLVKSHGIGRSSVTDGKLIVTCIPCAVFVDDSTGHYPESTLSAVRLILDYNVSSIFAPIRHRVRWGR